MAKTRLFLLVLSCVAVARACGNFCKKSPTTVSGTLAPREFCSGDLIFEDNFDDFNLDKWDHEITLAGGGNFEFQWYGNNRSNSFCENGFLYLRPTLTEDTLGYEGMTSGLLSLHGGNPAEVCTNAQFNGCEREGSPSNIINPIRSARIRTSTSFNFKYGKVEVKAKLPTGDWLWPAIWFMPRYNTYGTWPNSGEIDLMESRGNKELTNNGVHIGTQQVGQTLHFGPYWNLNGYNYASYVVNDRSGFDNGYHLYQLEWTPDYLRFMTDGKETTTIKGPFWELGKFDERAPNTENPWRTAKTKQAPFDQEYFIIMNLAVGGVNGYFPDEAVGPYKKPWSNQSPAALTDFWSNRESWLPSWDLKTNFSESASFKVDYVKIWAL